MLCIGIVNVISCVETIRTKATTEQQDITRLQDFDPGWVVNKGEGLKGGTGGMGT